MKTERSITNTCIFCHYSSIFFSRSTTYIQILWLTSDFTVVTRSDLNVFQIFSPLTKLWNRKTKLWRQNQRMPRGDGQNLPSFRCITAREIESLARSYNLHQTLTELIVKFQHGSVITSQSGKSSSGRPQQRRLGPQDFRRWMERYLRCSKTFH